MFTQLSTFLLSSLLAIPALTCQIGGDTTDMTGAPNRDTLCVPQGEGQWTFAMSTDGIDEGIPGDRGVGNPSAVQSTFFEIFDNACNPKGLYDPGNNPGANSCGVPWSIEENFLADVLTITTVSMDVGDPYFEFTYGDGEYSINNNHCGCANGPATFSQATKDCKCAFPVSGKSSKKREVGFVA